MIYAEHLYTDFACRHYNIANIQVESQKVAEDENVYFFDFGGKTVNIKIRLVDDAGEIIIRRNVYNENPVYAHNILVAGAYVALKNAGKVPPEIFIIDGRKIPVNGDIVHFLIFAADKESYRRIIHSIHMSTVQAIAHPAVCLKCPFQNVCTISPIEFGELYDSYPEHYTLREFEFNYSSIVNVLKWEIDYIFGEGTYLYEVFRYILKNWGKIYDSGYKIIQHLMSSFHTDRDPVEMAGNFEFLSKEVGMSRTAVILSVVANAMDLKFIPTNMISHPLDSFKGLLEEYKGYVIPSKTVWNRFSKIPYDKARKVFEKCIDCREEGRNFTPVWFESILSKNVRHDREKRYGLEV